MRICSLLPGATEIVFALGMGDSLVAVSHECNYPEEAARLPKVTRSRINPAASSREIEDAVAASLQAGTPLYGLELELLERLQPDLIITQGLCDVCAVSTSLVEGTICSLSSRPAVLNLGPHSLTDILDNIRSVAIAIKREHAAEVLIEKLNARIESARKRAAIVPSRPRVFCMEWVDPPYRGGHWMKELVEIAGGRDDLANDASPSCRIEWKQVIQYAPEIVVLTCCGYDLERCKREGEILATFPEIFDLPAAQQNRIYATAGSGYFSRPGPRIVDSLEILAHLIHPEEFPPPALSEEAFSTLTLVRTGAESRSWTS
jgi:iron complex transport system substrate-binding protein